MQADFSIVKDKALPLAGTVLFALFVVMLPRYTDTAKTWYVLLILLALIFLLLNPGQLRQTSRAERLFFGAVIFNFLWIAFCYYANGEPGRGASFLWGRHFYFLFLIPLFFLFRKSIISERVILLSLFASIAISLGDILLDLSQGIDHRLQGMNPNGFGPIQLCLSGMLLFYFVEYRGRKMRWLAMAGFLLGLATVVFSQSRNTWMTLALLSAVFVLYIARALPLWKRIALVGVLLTLISSLYLLPMVEQRIDSGVSSLQRYLASEDYRDDSRLSSLGSRIELWKAGWKIFLENPFIGVGVGGFKPTATANSERYRVNDIVHRYKYVHNQYLAALATRGLPGLVLFLLVMSIPIYIAVSTKSPRPDSRVARLSIILLCLIYLIGSLAEDHFEAKAATMFVGVMLPLLLARISCEDSLTLPTMST